MLNQAAFRRGLRRMCRKVKNVQETARMFRKVKNVPESEECAVNRVYSMVCSGSIRSLAHSSFWQPITSPSIIALVSQLFVNCSQQCSQLCHLCHQSPMPVPVRRGASVSACLTSAAAVHGWCTWGHAGMHGYMQGTHPPPLLHPKMHALPTLPFLPLSA